MDFLPSFFDHFEDRLNLAVYDINQDLRMSDYGRSSSIPHVRQPQQALSSTALANPFEQTERAKVSAIDRIKQKALQARQIAPDAIKQFEADLDALIGEKAGLDEKRAAAVSPHQEAIAGVKGEIDGLKSAIDILSNGE